MNEGRPLNLNQRRRPRRALVPAERAAAPRLYMARSRRKLQDVYLGDPNEAGHGSRLKWFVSTCVAAAVGVVAIGTVIYGSMDADEAGLPATRTASRSVWERVWDSDRVGPSSQPNKPQSRDQLNSRGKTDRLLIAAGGAVSRHIIHDSVRQRRGAREYIQFKPYARIVGRLPVGPPPADAQIPAFNPFRLYANLDPIDDASDAAAAGLGDDNIATKVVELLGGFLPEEDGQELEAEEVSGMVARASETLLDTEIRPAFGPDGAVAAKSEPDGPARPTPAAEPLPPHTTVLSKAVADADEPDDVDGQQTQTIKVAAGDTLMTIMRRVRSQDAEARDVFDKANSTYDLTQMKEGYEVRLTVAPSPTNPKKVVPVRVSIFADGHQHKVTVARSDTGEYLIRGDSADAEIASAARDSEQRATLYASLYATALEQRIPADIIELILKINSYDVDFKRRVRPNDGFEFFFDLKDEDKNGDGTPGELLFTAITAAGDTKKFFRYRTPDGVVEYYDEDGNNSKKFLMRKPVRGEEARLTSGFGMRYHPLFGVRRMHSGIDWAAPIGTPILAAGAGVIEKAGREGGYGNYVRIRHANGYKTAYGHMLKFAPGAVPNAKVRQGQIIGYLGSTGSSTGPHLHFEILVNNGFVDPMRIQVPRERKLTGRELADYQKERARIDDLMRRPPVRSIASTEALVPDARTASSPVTTATTK